MGVNTLAYKIVQQSIGEEPIKIHSTLRVTPAMEAGLAHYVWTIEEVVGLLDKRSISQGLRMAS
jgi:hypothetical protein